MGKTNVFARSVGEKAMSLITIMAMIFLTGGSLVPVVAFATTPVWTINFVTLDGGASTTVVSGGDIAVVIDVTIVGGGSEDDWKSTGWRISDTSGSMTCINKPAPDFTAGGNHTESFDITAPSSVGTYNVYFKVYKDNSCSGEKASLTMTDAVTVTKPDLRAAKTNDLNGGNAVVGVPFTWTIRVQNIGSADAVFEKGEYILKDFMPVQYVGTYGDVTILASAGVVGVPSKLDCDQNQSLKADLMCKVKNTNGYSIIIPPGDYIDFSVVVNPTQTGTINNPRGGCPDNICKTDSGNHVSESNEDNNSCSNSVTIVPAPVCGDNSVNQSSEQCDAGQNNGAVCSAEYGQTCNYCSASCETETVQGPYCGDSVKNGQEECDGAAGVGEHQQCSAQCELSCVEGYHSTDGGCAPDEIQYPIYTSDTSACPQGTLAELAGTYDVGSTDADGVSFGTTLNHYYIFEASGTFIPTSAPGYLSDAGYTTIDGILSSLYGINGTPPDKGAHALLADLGSGVGILDWGAFTDT
ncbi:MAG: hypothetical protein V1701_04055, partial [Planctomycetota bacterium]